MFEKDKNARKYMKQVRSYLIFNPWKKRKMLKELSAMVQIFLEESKDVSYDAFINAFGTPENMANEMMLRDFSGEEIREKNNRRKWFRYMRMIVLSIICVCACATAVFFYWQRENNPHQIETIVYESEEKIPEITRNGLKYGLSYQLDVEGNIITAFDVQGNIVDVDASGIPQKEK